MKTEMTTNSINVDCSPSDSTKLASLLALAAGAMAMPQNSNADIIFTDLSSSPVQVGFLGGVASYTLQLPGTVLFGFERTQRSTTTTFPITTTIHYRTVWASDQFGPVFAKIQSNGNGFAVPLDYGAGWNQVLTLTYSAALGVATTSGRSSSGYSNKYLAFRFVDSTAGNALRYGWIEVSLSITFVSGNGNIGGPNVTIHGYAYENTGAQPTMGQRGAVPEPSSAALMVIGALALGAPGLRKWRQSQRGQ
jgi:hypothetical protein